MNGPPNIENLLNLMRREAMKALGSRGLVKLGNVSSYDPSTYTCKVVLADADADGNQVETGWLPIGAQAVGNGFGIFAAPNIGDQADVHFVEGDRNVGYVSVRFFQTGTIGANQVSAGEIWLVHASGSHVKMTNDGALSLADANGNTVVMNASGINISSPAVVTLPGLTAAGGNLSMGTGASDTLLTVTGQLVTMVNGVPVNVLPPGGSSYLNLSFFSNLTAQINGATSCAELQSIVTSSFTQLAAQQSSITNMLTSIAPIAALLTPPTSPTEAVTWVTNFISNVLTPMAPVAPLEAQQAALTAQIAALTTAFTTKASTFDSCSITPP